MKSKAKRWSILTQLLLFLMPLITLFISTSSYLQYKRAVDSLTERELQKKENIEGGVKLFIDNYDLSLCF